MTRAKKSKTIAESAKASVRISFAGNCGFGWCDVEKLSIKALVGKIFILVADPSGSLKK